MRILFFTHYFPPEGNAPASRTWENCRRWVAAGHEVTVVTGVPNVPNGVVYEGYRNRLRQKEVVDGIEVIRVWTFVAPNKGTARRILNYVSYAVSALVLNLVLKKPDVVVTTSPQFFCGWAGVLWGRLRRVPTVLEIRDIWPESIAAVGAMSDESLGVRVLKRMERWMYGLADHIVCVGRGYRENLLEKAVSPEKISIVTNGADLQFFSPGEKQPEFLKRFGLEEKFVVAYIGTIGMAAGLRVVLRVAKLLQDRGQTDIAFMLVGDGAERQQLETEAVESELDNVVFTGRVAKSEIPAALRSADLCLVHLRDTPLFQTVLPSKLFEAMACGRPVLLGVRGEAREILEDAFAGISIEPESESDLISAVERMRSDAEEMKAFGASGRSYVEEHYDRDCLAEDYMKILKDLCESRA